MICRYARLVVGGKTVSVVAKTFHQIGKTVVNNHVIAIQHKEAEKLKTVIWELRYMQGECSPKTRKGKSLLKLDS